ncbi:hypothetical protein [Rathayibacter soli]|uniref:hypothetical protein n=1 Tax=Rathayibacter soli TaxID=3144168 RepID=UPI0027E4FDC9|nr:hypothetical protein [Glaciibacter superstes]
MSFSFPRESRIVSSGSWSHDYVQAESTLLARQFRMRRYDAPARYAAAMRHSRIPIY